MKAKPHKSKAKQSSSSKSTQIPKSVDQLRLRRCARNASKLFARLLVAMDQFASASRVLRLRVRADLKAIIFSLPVNSRRRIVPVLRAEIEKLFHTPQIVRSLGKKLARNALARDTIEVNAHDKCLGSDGGGVTVIVGNVSADACVTGSPSGGPTGGGLSGGFSY